MIKKTLKRTTLILLLLLAGSITLIACTTIGSNPKGERQQRIEQSAQYNLDDKQFENPIATPLSTGRSWFSITMDFIMNGEGRTPDQALPEDAPPLSSLDNKSRDIRFIWFGHSTILLELEGKRILIDPIFSDYASPVPYVIKRFQPPVFTIDQIKDIDVVIISHDHYDHLDYTTIRELRERDIHFFTPLGVGAHLEYWGINPDNVHELDWWESQSFNGLTLTATPAQHFSGRGLSNGNSTLWASWAIQGSKQSVFFSGDSGYSEHYKQIGETLGPFDLTFLENGAYSVDWKFVHQLPEEAVQAHKDLQGKAMVPVHWGMFTLALHSWHEPIERVSAEADKQDINLLSPKLGQLVSTAQLQQGKPDQNWWQALVNTKNTE